MPDDQGRPTPDELEAYSATLQQLIEEARALQTVVTDELRRMRRLNRTAVTATVERRRNDRRAIERHPIDRRTRDRHDPERQGAEGNKTSR